MKSGEISKDELMGEASELLSKVKEMGGVDEKRSIKESQKQKGFFGMFGGSKTKTRRRHKNKSRRR